MKTIIQLSILSFFVFVSANLANGQDFVYKPKNPAFGGDTFNYNWLLNSANAQNQIEDPATEEVSTASRTRTDELTRFTESLNRQILSQLSRSLVSTQFGSGELEAGSYVVGSFEINVEEVSDGLSVTIFDSSTGSETQIIIPFE